MEASAAAVSAGSRTTMKATSYKFELKMGLATREAYGQALAELLATGSYGALDASALSRDRFARGALAFEALHI